MTPAMFDVDFSRLTVYTVYVTSSIRMEGMNQLATRYHHSKNVSSVVMATTSEHHSSAAQYVVSVSFINNFAIIETVLSTVTCANLRMPAYVHAVRTCMFVPFPLCSSNLLLWL